MKSAWTLVGQRHCTGIFHHREDAEDWANLFAPELGLTAIELLLHDEVAGNISAVTWVKGELPIRPENKDWMN
jgi:hypothetical protein